MGQPQIIARGQRRRPPLVDEVAADIARRIRGGKPAAGSALPPERELAADLGVSRPVVREALRQLRSRGLVDIRHGVGVLAADRVHQPVAEALDLVLPAGRRRLLQVAEVRLLLEPHIARQAARTASVAMLRKLDAVQGDLRAAVDPDAAIELDLQFHRLLARAAGNAALLLTLEALADLGRQSRKVTLSQFGVERAWRQHQTILDAVRRRDPDAAADAMQQHIEAAAADLARSRRIK